MRSFAMHMNTMQKKEKEDLEQIINTYFAISIQSPLYTSFLSTSRNKTLSNQKGYESDSEKSDKSPSTITEELQSNASAQNSLFKKQKVTKEKLAELNDLYHITRDSQLHHDFLVQITENKEIIEEEKKREKN
ncbi:39153_t:CDS:2 [Gigaspora margarita]|uniref:39153_t:CDS:1 n=1 Tax=Gigaspora margarita TaxID=4874 RepID=A0ABN7VBJ5_GIGMA|nr:39153_t:CDS:2 [Gigaspora margarita]